MTIIKPAARHKARRFAVQALYQWHFTQDSSAKILLDLQAENNMSKVDMPYFTALVTGSLEQIQTLDAALVPFLGRAIDAIDPLALSVLRLSSYELLERLDVPANVILDEAIKITKIFGAEESYKFVNGVLDKASKEWRTIENTPDIGHHTNDDDT